LTDGAGDTVNDYFDSEGVYKTITERSWDKGGYVSNRVFLRDTVTKHQEEMSCGYYKQTDAFIKLLKIRTRCNALGFYVISSAELKRYGKYFFDDEMDSTKIQKEFNANKSLVTHKSAFDEYYLIKSDKKDLNDEELVVKSSMTNKTLANAFMKYNNNKLANRAVLNRFIGMIA
jgi:hypothetical protein